MTGHFIKGYSDALAWLAIGENFETTDMRGEFSLSDLPEADRAEVVTDLADFYARAGLAELASLTDDERAGADFYLTRNRHGAGFWDGRWPEAMGRRLTALAHEYGSQSLVAGADGSFSIING